MFSVGQRVRLRTGHTLMIVLEVVGNKMRAQYAHSSCNETVANRWRNCSDYIAWDRDEEKKEPKEMTKLYNVKGTDIYGTVLAHNSAGHIVLELKGRDADVKAFPPEQLEEVKPYTIAIKMATGTVNHYTTHYRRFKVGDFLLLQNLTIAEVVDLDTKRDNPSGKLQAVLLPTLSLDEPEGTQQDNSDG